MMKRLFYTVQAGLWLLTAWWLPQTASAQCPLACNNQVNVSVPSEGCSMTVTVAMVLQESEQYCQGEKIVQVLDQDENLIAGSPVLTYQQVGKVLKYKVIHPASGNSCWGYLNVEDKSGPSISNCGPVTAYCFQDLRPTYEGGSIATPVFSDCSGYTRTYRDAVTKGECNDSYSARIVRTWTATDDKGNTTTCNQVITVARVSLRDYTPNCPVQRELTCNSTAPPSTDPKDTGYPYINISGTNHFLRTGVENYCQIAVTYEDEVFPLCGGSKKILRKWSVYDWCVPTQPGVNPWTCIQVIKVLDERGPAITCPAAFTVGTITTACEANVTFPAATVSDACSSFNVEIQTPVGLVQGNGGTKNKVPAGVHTITYIATDACGNVSTCSTRLTVQDKAPPTAICDENTTVALNADGTALVYATTFDDGSTDNCELSHFLVSRMANSCAPQSAFDKFVAFTCCDVDKTTMVVFRVFDKAGNYNDCMVEVRVQDKLPPTLTCPPDKSVDCSSDLTNLSIFGNAIVHDNCSATPAEVAVKNLNNCGTGVINRIFTATDGSGRKGTCTQVITVYNPTPFNGSRDIIWPRDYTTNACGTDITPENLPVAPVNYAKPTFRSDACDLVAVGYEDQVLNIAYPACYKVLRKWSVVDWCRYDPAFPERGGIWEHTQIIKVLDEKAPVLTCPANVTVNNLENDCAAIQVEIPAVKAEDCSAQLVYSYRIDYHSDGVIDVNRVGANASGKYPTGVHKVIFYVTDGCDNQATCEITVTVKDGKKPTASCINGLAVDLMEMNGGGMIELEPQMFNASSKDNCTPVDQLQFSLDRKVFTCADLGRQTVYLTVKDAAGNATTCETYVIIQDFRGICPEGSVAKAMIAGSIQTGSELGVDQVKLFINGPMNDSTMSNTNGQFAFHSLDLQQDYTVRPVRDDQPLNGISTLDLIRITKHILGVNRFTSPYDMIAADVNRSGNISALDIVQLRRLLLQIDTRLTNNTSWRFVDKNYVFPDPSNPFLAPFPEVYSVNNLNTNELAANFVAVKIGDVNASAVPNQAVAIENRSGGPDWFLQLTDRSFRKGERFEVSLTAEETADLKGLQWALQFDPAVLQMSGWEPGLLNESNIGFTGLAEGRMLASWDNTENTTQQHQQFLQMTFTALTDGKLSDHLALLEAPLSSEAYLEKDGDTGTHAIRLKWVQENAAGAGFELFQNKPNPFRGQTSIGFYLPEPSAAVLTVYDLSGRMLQQVKGDYAAGYQEVEIDLSGMETGGVLYYRLQTNDRTATRKMVLIN